MRRAWAIRVTFRTKRPGPVRATVDRVSTPIHLLERSRRQLSRSAGHAHGFTAFQPRPRAGEATGAAARAARQSGGDWCRFDRGRRTLLRAQRRQAIAASRRGRAESGTSTEANLRVISGVGGDRERSARGRMAFVLCSCGGGRYCAVATRASCTFTAPLHYFTRRAPGRSLAPGETEGPGCHFETGRNHFASERCGHYRAPGICAGLLALLAVSWPTPDDDLVRDLLTRRRSTVTACWA